MNWPTGSDADRNRRAERAASREPRQAVLALGQFVVEEPEHSGLGLLIEAGRKPEALAQAARTPSGRGRRSVLAAALERNLPRRPAHFTALEVQRSLFTRLPAVLSLTAIRGQTFTPEPMLPPARIAGHEVAADADGLPDDPQARADVYHLGRLAAACAKPCSWTARELARLLCPRVLELRRRHLRRTWTAAAALRAARITVNPRTAEWAPIATVEPMPDIQRIVLGPPAWWRRQSRVWRVSGALQRRQLLPEHLAALVDALEHVIAWSAPAPDRRPALLRAGAEPLIVDARHVLAFAGMPDRPDSNRGRQRFHQLRDAIGRYGLDRRHGGSVTVVGFRRGARNRPAALEVQAGPAFIQAAELAHQSANVWHRVPLEKLTRVAGPYPR